MSKDDIILKLRNGLILQSLTLKQLRTQLMIARISALVFFALALFEILIIGMGGLV